MTICTKNRTEYILLMNDVMSCMKTEKKKKKNNIGKYRRSKELASIFQCVFRGCNSWQGLLVHKECAASDAGNMKDKKIKMKHKFYCFSQEAISLRPWCSKFSYDK